MLRKLFTGTLNRRHYPVRFSSTVDYTNELSLNDYHEVSDKTLEEISDDLESLLEDRYDRGADVCLNNGVLTVTVDRENTYVINKQTPNKQIWLSSPISGPMRFDLVSGQWVEKNSKVELKQILNKELSHLLKDEKDC